ncbi:MAG: hypothetical protein C0436_00580 [Alphaproteobacteria bacterium]|nr:hypothetical protein [Alphaproteobacteria bacterium]
MEGNLAMHEGKTTDCVMEGIRLLKEVYTGKDINVAMIEDDVFALCKERDALLVCVAELKSKLAGTPLDIVDRHVVEERERCIDRALAWWAITENLDSIPTNVAAEGIRAALEERHPDLDLNPQP